jgi:NMD protein affecting ribosome stability and mRNA decay
MLSCAEVTGLVTSFLDKRMPIRQRMSFRMHIAMCPHCRRYLRQMKATVKVSGRLPVETIPPEVRDALAEALARMSRGDRRDDEK